MKDYQMKVRSRLLANKIKKNEEDHLNIQFIASMLPTATDMHKFTKIMAKDQVFENKEGFKVVTKIRTYKDKERLEYLLNNKLSDV